MNFKKREKYMKKIAMGFLIFICSASLVYAGDNELCLDKIKLYDKSAKIVEMKKFNVGEFYRDNEMRKQQINELISAACIDMLSKECVDAVNIWGNYIERYDEKTNKIKSFSLESEANYYKIKTNLYTYVCATRGNKAVSVVDN